MAPDDRPFDAASAGALLLVGASVPVGIVARLLLGRRATPVVAVAVAIAAVILLVARAAHRVRKPPERAPAELEPDEMLLRRGRAVRVLRTGGVAGELLVTSQRILFRPHEPTVLDRDERWPIGDVVAVVRGRSFGLFPDALAITLSGERTIRFRVRDREAWRGALAEARRDPLPRTAYR
jgi:hypothetical protein